MRRYCFFLCVFLIACHQKPDNPVIEPIICTNVSVDGISDGLEYSYISLTPMVELTFNMPISQMSALTHIKMYDINDTTVPIQLNFVDDDCKILVLPAKLQGWQKYILNIPVSLTGRDNSTLHSSITVNLVTALDSIDKFPRISDDELLTLVQKQTFKYFWDFGHPVSGMARDRNTIVDFVTTGGTGFGVMAMIVAVERKFITRDAAVARIQTIVSFLKNSCTKYHGAFAHFLNGQTGVTQPFAPPKDNGADLVETSFLLQGLLSARQYFSEENPDETQLREDITALWEEVEWDWYRSDGKNTLYWNWSPEYAWEVNLPVTGWNECLITYVLAASSPTHSISKTVYDEGFALNGRTKNGASYYGISLPLGNPYGGPLFFSHYSFLGLNPQNLRDTYTDYWEQNVAHSLINMKYCIDNPLQYMGYSADCWGLTASDGNTAYNAHSPTNDKGVIAPTAALSSMPYTPEESMRALDFFYYKLGDKIWAEHGYGFVDAFNVTAGWYDDQFLAIDQGPIIVMIENYRTGLLWDIFMKIPEIQAGLSKLGFSY